MVSYKEVSTTPFEGQKPGTSGLRKKVKVFQQPHYVENFVQALLSAIPEGAQDATLVVGGDGRFYNTEVIGIIANLAAGNGVSKLIIGQNGLLSTPAASHVIRKRKATGGIILTASHNPGGPTNDFGIKYDMSHGEPAPEKVTNKIWEISKSLTSYRVAAEPDKLDIKTVGTKKYFGETLEVEIIDSLNDYVELMDEIFDLRLIRSFLEKFKVPIIFDGMNGITGPYVRKIFVEYLGLDPAKTLQHTIPLEDFGGMHPDPNLTYAKTLVDKVNADKIPFGAASDGDGDRNMIYGYKAFVSPGDSVAIIAHHADRIPYFKKHGVQGLARSMPTASAIDRVAKAKNLNVYEVPTGWKFFCALFDAEKLSICGEESFGTGSNHVREKDGVWAVLAWLNILASVSTEHGRASSIAEIQHEFWQTYGRTYFTRFDYEEVSSEGANKMISELTSKIDDPGFIGTKIGSLTVKSAGDFSYTDLDGSVSDHQGLYVTFEGGARTVVRLSGTGSSGATIRLYLEKHEPTDLYLDAQEYLAPTMSNIQSMLKIKEYVGRDKPNVIT